MSKFTLLVNSKLAKGNYDKISSKIKKELNDINNMEILCLINDIKQKETTLHKLNIKSKREKLITKFEVM